MVEELMVIKAINGSEDDFLDLINIYKEQIYRTAYAYVKNEELALDIVSETVCKAYICIKNLREPKYFKTWIIKITINISTTIYNKEKKLVYINENILEDNLAKENNTDERLYLLEAINTLEKKHKEVIILKYFDDFTLKEISQVLDIPIGTAKTYLNKGLKALRVYMESEVV